MDNIPVILSIRQCAERLNLSYSFIEQLVFENKILYFKSGKKRLINYQSLIDYLNGGGQNESSESIE